MEVKERKPRPNLWPFVLPVLGILAAGGILLSIAPKEYIKAQLAKTTAFADIVKKNPGDFANAALWDIGFAVVYGALALYFAWRVIGLQRERVIRDGTNIERASLALIFAGALCDIVENVLLHQDAQKVAEGADPTCNTVMLWFGYCKWSALALGVLALAWRAFAPRRPHENEWLHASPANRPDHAKKSWDPPDDEDKKGKKKKDPPGLAGDEKEKDRLGLCFSGGGIRSASFSLGVIQALQKGGVLRNAKYLAAVSGGGYIAAGVAVANSLDKQEGEEPFAPGSRHERHFRDNSSYLIPNLRGGFAALATLISGLLFGLLVIWIVLFAVGHPIGWLVGAAHDELDAREPVTLVDREIAKAAISTVEEIPSTDGDSRLFAVHLEEDSSVEESKRAACLDAEPFDNDSGDYAFVVQEKRPGIVRVRDDTPKLIRRPVLEPVPIAPLEDCASADTDKGEAVFALLPKDIRVELEIVGKTALSAEDLREHIKIVRQPVILPKKGLLARDRVKFDPWMLFLSFGFLLAGALVAFLGMLLRLQARWRVWFVRVAFVVGGIGCALVMILIVLPWLSQFLADKLGPISSEEELPLDDAWVPSGGLLLVMTLALRSFFGRNQSAGGTAPSGASGNAVKKAWKWLVGAKEKLRWYEMTPFKIAAALAVIVVPLMMFLLQVMYAAAIGAEGKLFGFTVFNHTMPSWLFWPEWKRVLAVLVFLVVLQRFVDGHAWSLHPFYKRRLSDAFFRQGQKKYDKGPVRFQDLTEERKGFPQLLLCCAVNLSEKGVVPPARRAASWTFSSTEIGGPLVGYVSPQKYWERLGKARQKDITIPAAMSISGAAFSPAMGKMNYGPVGSLFAFANLRLGVWLPHPQYVAKMKRGERWIDRPGWSWFLREVAGRYRRREPYLYVSDGGHWDNLGLVELLRRGCTQIVCVNAGGDSQESFATIGEAIALAREELCVNIDIDPSPLRPPIEGEKTGRQLRRKAAPHEAVSLATASYVKGSFTYPNGRIGCIWLIEPALTAGMPFDVHAYAEEEASFPDIATGDQIFNHQQFEAYRALGYYQGSQIAPG